MTTTTKQTHQPRARQVRRLAVALAMGASAALATIGGTGIALAFEPNSPAAVFPPGPGVVGPEI